MTRNALFCLALLCPALLLAEALPKGQLEEWDLDLFNAANANKNAKCESFGILDPPGHHAGYYSIDGTEDGHLFYMYFENRYKDPDAPFVFWTNGGPGCSSLFGLFLENGPYDLQDDMTLCWKDYGWDIGHNIIFVEQPIGVGFSYSRKSKDKVFTEDRVGHDMLEFFYAFLDKHPELADKDLYITGESFAGHYLPAIAKTIILANARQTGQQLNLKGVFLVDPWTSPTHHYFSYPNYAFQEGLIGESTKNMMLEAWVDCDNALTLCDVQVPFLKSFFCNGAYALCQSRLFQPILFLHPFLNYYDIRRRDCTISGCYDISHITKFLNIKQVKDALKVKSTIKWENCRDGIRRDMAWDVATDVMSTVASVLNYGGVNVSVTVGDQDLICNYMGNERWVDAMKWDKQIDWGAVKKSPLMSNGVEAGYYREAAPLSFVKVNQAGHMIPMDQPAVGLQLLTTFTRGKSYADIVEFKPPAAPATGIQPNLPVT